MSMISAQCDQLRERAKELCSLAPDPAVPYLVPSTKETMALAMRSAASEMEDAANTIWELRCKLVDIVADLQEALAENARLREERDGWKKLCTDQEIMHVMREETLDNENERLRQLVLDMRTCIDHACMCEFCPLFITSEDMDERRCIADMKAHMRELGVDDVLRTE